MSSRWSAALVAAALAAGVYACADQERAGGPAAPETVRADAPKVKTCDTGALAKDARAYFPQPEVREAQTLIGAVSTACADGDDASRVALAWQTMALIETLLEDGRGGSPAAGALVVNGLIDCIEGPCTATPSNDVAVAGALGPQGLFAVRAGGTAPAIARAPVSFTDFDGAANRALWGLEVDASWSQVTGTSPVLLYGAPRVGATLLDRRFGNLGFDMNRYPVPTPGTPGNPFQGDALHVGVCFEFEVTLPHADDDEGRPAMAPRMQREAVLLEAHEPGFCADAFPAVQSASVLGPALGLVRTLLPGSWFALALTDRKAPSLGGTPLNFSGFAPVAAEVEGSMEFVTPPPTQAVENEALGEIRVRARSGAGTPIEKVLVTLSIRANQGDPAGAVISGDIASLTDEEEGVALFPDEGASPSIGKPGGYRLCANAVLEGFTFPEICSTLHVRNANGG
jgi:hypothetical protein